MGLYKFLTLALVLSIFAISSSTASPIELQDEPYAYDEYAEPGDDGWIPWKRSTWSPHPSDYNPMRRPGPYPRNAIPKRDTPYHPHARIITIKQRSPIFDESSEFSDFIGGGRDKKQTRVGTLMNKLRGSKGSNSGSMNVRRNNGRNTSEQKE